VLTRLDTEIAKTASGPPALTAGVELQKELEARVNSVVGPNGFVFVLFFTSARSTSERCSSSTPRRARAVVYVIGNPLIVQSILQHSLRAAHNAPLRVLLTETADGAGTEVVYNLPSSVMALNDNEVLDRKLEGLVERIMAAL
ncbi:hypothetical protein C8J57DRAFT_1091567, partial [Mycena rebaudengoi]